MKVKKLLAGILSVAMVLGTMAFPASAADDWGDNCVVARGIAGDGSDVYYKTLAEALNAVYMSNPTSTVTIDCKAGANIGSMSHAHVADDIVINGNGATVSGDLEIDMYTYSRETGKNVTSGGEYLTKDIIVKVNDLNGVAAWGQRHTGNTITLEFNNCQNMQEVMFRTSPVSDDIGSMNITLNGCSFDVDNGAVKGTSVHVTSAADIKVKNCTFKGVAAPINLNNKSTKAQTLNVEGCTFTDCAEEAATKALDSENDKPSTYAAPIRCVTTQETGTIKAAVKDCTFTNCSTIGHGDILLGDGRVGKASTNGAQVTVSGTAATVKTEFPGAAEKTNTVEVKADDAETTITMQEASNAVAKIGDVGYATLAEATAAATENNEITIIGKIAVAAKDIPQNKTLNFKGQDATSELEFNYGESNSEARNGYYVDGSKLTFNNLIMTWFEDQNYQGLIRPESATYNDCTINGQVFLYGTEETFNRCKFVQGKANYNVWTYGAGKVTFKNCEFSGKGKSILIYNEGGNENKPYNEKTALGVKINDCTFNASEPIDGKAAVEIDSSFCPFDVEITGNTTATGFGTGSTSKDSLYNAKKMNTTIVDKSQDKTNLKVFGDTIDLESVRRVNNPWEYDTDSGYFTINGEKSGVMRFMFKITPQETIKEAGIKYINADNIPALLSGSTVKTITNLTAFQGDIINISPDKVEDGAKYYAAAYVIAGDTTIWSDVIECSMNWAQEFTTTDGGAE